MERVKLLNSFFDKYIFTNNLKYEHNNFYLMNIPFAIVPIEVLVSIAKQNDSQIKQTLYSSVKQDAREKLVRQFELDFGMDKKKALTLFETFFTASGWGKIKNIDTDFEEKRAILTVENSPVAAALKGKVSYPVDLMLRAVFAGMFSEIFGEDVDCVESECAAVSGERCKFIIKAEADFDISKKIVRDQLIFKDL